MMNLFKRSLITNSSSRGVLRRGATIIFYRATRVSITMKKTQSAGGVVLNAKGEVLVVNQNWDSWSLPKGHIDPGEDALGAARREIYEESGLTNLTLVRDLGSYKRYKISLDGGDDTSELKTIHMFLFTTDQEKLEPIDPGNPEARWLKKSEVASLLTHQKDKEFFQGIVGGLKNGPTT